MIQAVCDTLSDEKCAEMTQIQSQGLSRVRWNHTNRPIKVLRLISRTAA